LSGQLTLRCVVQSKPAGPPSCLQVKTPVKLSAPDYINCLFDWVEDQAGFTF